MEKCCYGHLEYFTDMWNIYSPFGTFCVYLVHFPGLGIMHQEKSGNPVHKSKNNWKESFFSLTCYRIFSFHGR
jgi:hypothetical protein